MKKSLWLKIFFSCFAIIFCIAAEDCPQPLPRADSPQIAEQEKHVIRYLAKHVATEGPIVYLLEVDGAKYVVVEGGGLAITPTSTKTNKKEN